MDELQEARNLINEIDDKMAKLFEERMQAVEKVIAYKMEHGLAIFDESREKEVIDKNMQKVSNIYQEYYVKFLKEMMNISKQYQQQIMEENKNG